MRLATFNVESLFERPVAMNQSTWEQGQAPLEWFAQLNTILDKDVYAAVDKASILDLLRKLGLLNADSGGKWAILRQNRGHLIKRPRAGDPEIVANGRQDWIGWIELKRDALEEAPIQNTARVLRDVAADVQAIVEAESRIALKGFSDDVVPAVGGSPFDHVMLIDGNDERGIDVGVLARSGYDIESIRSHVDDTDSQGLIFSRDCPEYRITTPSAQHLTVLVNHLKSKGFGPPASNTAKRLRQATRVAEIYARLQADGEINVAVVGDFNDYPRPGGPLQPLLDGTDLRDVSEHPSFTSDDRPGTFGNGTKTMKFDYVLLSPDLFDRVQGGTIWRKGVWGGTNGTLWEKYAEIKKQADQASDHAAIYADLNL